MGHKKDANFVWADLSANDITSAKNFYKGVFGWTLHKDSSVFDQIPDEEDKFGANNSEYYGAFAGGKAVAGIFDMPAFFRKIKMPSFWMSYLSVGDIQSVVERASKIEGTVIEVGPTPFYKGQIALIRDPAGAGFTVYEGPELSKRGDGSKSGHVVWNELIVDSVKKVKPFYEDVFGFKLTKDTSFEGVRYKITNPAGEEIAAVEEVDSSIRGSKVYWIPFFSVNTLTLFEQKVIANNGKILHKTQNHYGNMALVSDSQDGSFGAVETGNTGGYNGAFNDFKFKTAIAFPLVVTSIIFNWQWFWGIVFMLLVYPDLKSGNTFFVEPLSRSKNPLWYWSIILTWLVVSVYLISTAF